MTLAQSANGPEASPYVADWLMDSDVANMGEKQGIVIPTMVKTCLKSRKEQGKMGKRSMNWEERAKTWESPFTLSILLGRAS